MRRKSIIILAIVFLPITILYLGFKYLFKKFNKNRIYKFLQKLTIGDVDTITGYEFEEILLHIFNYFGFKSSVTKKSGDYGVDLFVKKKSVKYCIQAKLYYNHNVGSSAVQQIETGKRYFACDYAMVITNSKYTKQARDMANQLNVILLDRQDMSSILRELRLNNKKFLDKLLEDKLCLMK